MTDPTLQQINSVNELKFQAAEKILTEIIVMDRNTEYSRAVYPSLSEQRYDIYSSIKGLICSNLFVSFFPVLKINRNSLVYSIDIFISRNVHRTG